MMENSMRFGLMAVFAVSGSMVFLVHQVHKHLLSNFMKNFEFEMGDILCASQHGQKKLGYEKNHEGKKKVRFAKQVLEFPMENNNKSGRKKLVMKRTRRVKAEDVMENIPKWGCGPNKLEDVMPPNRAVLYKGIMNNNRGRFRF